MKNKSWQIIWLGFFISLLLPFNWLFWLGWQRLNYLAFPFGLSDAWMIFFFFYFLLFHKKQALLIITVGLCGWLISKNNPFTWLRLWSILRIFFLIIIAAFLNQKTNHNWQHFWLEKILFLIAFLSLGESILRNQIYHQGAFKVYLSSKPFYLSHLFYLHPNILAFVGLSLFWLSSLNSPQNKPLKTLATTIILILSGSVSGSFFFFVWLLFFAKEFSLLGITSLSFSLLLTNLETASLHFKWLFNHHLNHLNPIWPAISLNGLQANWSLQPIHNSFFLIKTSLGWPLLLISLIGIAWLFIVSEKKPKKLILISLCGWAMVDHFFITSISGQNLTAYLFAFLLAKE